MATKSKNYDLDIATDAILLLRDLNRIELEGSEKDAFISRILNKKIKQIESEMEQHAMDKRIDYVNRKVIELKTFERARDKHYTLMTKKEDNHE